MGLYRNSACFSLPYAYCLAMLFPLSAYIEAALQLAPYDKL